MKTIFEKPCPLCGAESKIIPKDYERKFLVKCTRNGDYYTEQTLEEKEIIDEHPYFKKIENNARREALIKQVKNNQDKDELPLISRY